MIRVESPESVHPYVPKDLILPNYVPLTLSQSTILGVYGSASLLIVTFVWIVAGRFPKISMTDKILMCWWVFSGLTHMIVEGYFVFTPEFFMQKKPTFLAELWKEYSKGDSRYVARASAIVAMEGITAVVEGPACILAAYAIATRKSYSHLVQIATAFGQLYGTAIYFIIAYLEGDNFAISQYYYYFYYVIMNSFWIWIPSLIVIRSWRTICATVRIRDPKKTKTR